MLEGEAFSSLKEEAHRFFGKEKNKTGHMDLKKFYTGVKFGLLFDMHSMAGQAMQSLLCSCFLGCHATLPPKKRLLTSELHSFPKISQSRLPFHFSERFRANLAVGDLSNQISFFIFTLHGGKVTNQQGDDGFP